MPQSEIARERRNIRKIIARGAERNVTFDIPIDLNTATLDELKDLHRNIYNYSSKITKTGEYLEGSDVKKFENKSRTAHARGKETISIDYEVDMEENPAETYDENRDQFDYDETPDYNTEYDYSSPEDSSYDYDSWDAANYDDSNAEDFSETTLEEEELYDSVLQDIRDLAGEYNDDAVSSLLDQIDIAISQIGRAQVVRNAINYSGLLVESAMKVAKYAGMAGRGAQETRLRNFQNFIAILYGTNPDKFMQDAERAAAHGTTFVSQLQNMEPPKGATTFETLEAGLALDFKRFWYKDESGNWAYYDSRKKQ